MFGLFFSRRPRPIGGRGAAGGPFPLPLGPLGTFGPVGDSGRGGFVKSPVLQSKGGVRLAPRLQMLLNIEKHHRIAYLEKEMRGAAAPRTPRFEEGNSALYRVAAKATDLGW